MYIHTCTCTHETRVHRRKHTLNASVKLIPIWVTSWLSKRRSASCSHYGWKALPSLVAHQDHLAECQTSAPPLSTSHSPSPTIVCLQSNHATICSGLATACTLTTRTASCVPMALGITDACVGMAVPKGKGAGHGCSMPHPMGNDCRHTLLTNRTKFYLNFPHLSFHQMHSPCPGGLECVDGSQASVASRTYIAPAVREGLAMESAEVGGIVHKHSNLMPNEV